MINIRNEINRTQFGSHSVSGYSDDDDDDDYGDDYVAMMIFLKIPYYDDSDDHQPQTFKWHWMQKRAI